MEATQAIPDILSGGDIRLRAQAGAFVYRRLRPAVLLTCFRGRDAGEFGTRPLDIVAQEFRYFEKPVEWFFDASLVENTTRAVSDQWTEWLRGHRAVLSRMHVLTADTGTHFRISLARHLSDSIKEMSIYTERAKWERALLLCAPDSNSAPPVHERFLEPPLGIETTSSETGLAISAPGSRWTFQPLANGVIFTTFAGHDTGDLTDPAIAEMQRLLDTTRGKLSWFIDLRKARNVATHVSQTWTAWLSAHHARLARVVALSPSPLFPLVLTVAKYRSGSERLFHIHREIEPFRDSLVRLTSENAAKAAGI